MSFRWVLALLVGQRPGWAWVSSYLIAEPFSLRQRLRFAFASCPMVCPGREGSLCGKRLRPHNLLLCSLLGPLGWLKAVLAHHLPRVWMKAGI